MQFRVLEPTDAEWNNAVSSAHSDIYHLPSYCEIAAKQEGGSPRALWFTRDRSFLLLPVIVRELPIWLRNISNAAYDALSPYGYSSPLLMNGSEDFLREALQVVPTVLNQLEVACLFVRLHPLLPIPLSPLGEVGQLVQHGSTVAIELSRSEEELRSQTRSSHRNEINKSIRRGMEASIDPEWKHYDDFRTIYDQTMSRVGASEGYFFDDEYFDGLRKALGKRLHLGVAKLDGRVTAAALFTEFKGIVQYHLSGTHDDAIRLYPTKLLLDHARWWAKERGNNWFHLGGGVGGREDSLFAFKRGYSETTMPFYSWRFVANPEAYTALNAEWSLKAGLPPDDIDGFFPAYRKPVQSLGSHYA